MDVDTGTLDFRVARAITGADRASFVRIYEDSFPRAERDESDALLSSIAEGERLCFVAYTVDELIGLAVLFPLRVHNVQFLEYFAIDARYRDHGVGSRFLEELGAQLRVRAETPPGIVFEVEHPDFASGEEQRLRRRRIEFYRRNGAVVVECAPAYRAPNLAGPGTLPYLLMWLLLQSGVPKLEGDLLRDCVHAILTESYELDGQDALVQEVVAQLTC